MNRRLAIITVLATAWLSGLTPASTQEPATLSGLEFQMERVAKRAAAIAGAKSKSPKHLNMGIRAVAKVAAEEFKTVAEAADWIYFLAAHTQLDHFGSRGQKKMGIGRLDGRYAKALGKLCGTELTAAKLRSVEINVRTSACYWKHLMTASGDATLATTYYLNGVNAGWLMRGGPTPPTNEVPADQLEMVAQLMPEYSDTQAQQGASAEQDRQIMSYYMSLSKEGGSRRVINAWTEREVSRLLGLTWTERQTLARLSSYHNRFQSHMAATPIPTSVRRSVVGLGAAPKRVSLLKNIGCFVPGMTKSDMTDTYGSLFIGGCVVKHIAASIKASSGKQPEVGELFATTALYARGMVPRGRYTHAAIDPSDLNPSVDQSISVGDMTRMINITNLNHHSLKEHKLSHRLLTMHAAASVAEVVFTNKKDRRAWFALLRIESNFDHSGRSHVGATGLGQLLPQYADDFGRNCGVSGMAPRDVLDVATNALLSACYFRMLSNQESLTAFALVGYNAGPHSKALDQARNLVGMNEESANYVARWNVVMELLERHDEETKTPPLAQTPSQETAI